MNKLRLPPFLDRVRIVEEPRIVKLNQDIRDGILFNDFKCHWLVQKGQSIGYRIGQQW